MPVENKIHQGRRTILHLVWLSFTFQPTGCLPGEFIIDQRQWSSLPRPTLFPPSFPISSFFPAVTVFSIPSCELPAQGYVKGVCRSYRALGKAPGVATKWDEGEGASPCSKCGHWAILTCCSQPPAGCATETTRGHGGGRNRVSPETWEKKSWIQNKDEAWTMQ